MRKFSSMFVLAALKNNEELLFQTYIIMCLPNSVYIECIHICVDPEVTLNDMKTNLQLWNKNKCNKVLFVRISPVMY